MWRLFFKSCLQLLSNFLILLFITFFAIFNIIFSSPSFSFSLFLRFSIYLWSIIHNLYTYPRYPAHFWREKSEKTLSLPESCIQDFRASRTHVLRDLPELPFIHLSNIYTGPTVSRYDMRCWEFWDRNCSTCPHGLYSLIGNKINNFNIVGEGNHISLWSIPNAQTLPLQTFLITFIWAWSS